MTTVYDLLQYYNDSDNMFISVAMFHENDDTVNQLAYNVSAITVNVLDTVLPKNKIAQTSKYVINDTLNVTSVGKSYLHEFIIIL